MILVTGAAGFIGSHLTERLLALGHEVIGLDNFEPFYPRAIKESNLARARTHRAFHFVEADIRDADALNSTVSRLGVAGKLSSIVHLAAKAGVRPSLLDPMGYTAANIIGTQNIFELARAARVPQVVFASSSSVYGVNPRVPWREDDHDLQPISPYASTKLATEMIGHAYAHTLGIRMIGLRFFTVYGPRQRPDLAIAKFTKLMRQGKPIPFYGDGSTRRDYTYVDDIVEGIVRCLDYRSTPFEILNLGNNRTVSLSELVDTLGRTFGVPPVLDRQPPQPGDVPQTWADVSRAGKLLGWAPHTRLEDGLARYREWLITDPSKVS